MPNIQTFIEASADDGKRRDGGFSNTSGSPYVGYRDAVDYYDCHLYFRWPSVTISGTITNAYIKIHSNDVNATAGTPELKIYGVDEDDPAAPTNLGEFDADPLTTASVAWTDGWVNNSFNQSPDISSVIQELVDSYTFEASALMLQVKNDKSTSSDHWNRSSHYDNDTDHAAELFIEYDTGEPPESAVIAEVTHDDGTLDEYDSTVTDGGDLSAHIDAAMGNTSYGMKLLIDNTAAIYGQVDFGAPTSNIIGIRFYIDPNELTMADGDRFRICHLRTTVPETQVHVELSYAIATGYSLKATCNNDAGTGTTTNTNISDAEHFIELYYEKATTNVSADGVFIVWVDGTQKSTKTNLDNFDRFTDTEHIQLGAVWAIDAGTSGTYYLDELKIVSNGSYIGPVALSKRARMRHVQQGMHLGMKLGT